MDQSEREELIQQFEGLIKDKDVSYAIAAMKSLILTSEKDVSTKTMQEFMAKMGEACKVLKSASPHVSVRSACELLLRFMTLSSTALEQSSDFASCKAILVSRGSHYLSRMEGSRNAVVETARSLIRPDAVLLTHARSRTVLAAMKAAARKGVTFSVIVTEAQPSCEGRSMVEELRREHIQATVALDAAAAVVLDRVDAVLLGAEVVCENGGIINRIGTYNVATLANLKNKPVYVLVESFKFVRYIPLNNASLPKEYFFPAETLKKCSSTESDQHPLVDYTPPHCLTLLYTDLGILPTSAVTEHLIKLYS